MLMTHLAKLEPETRASNPALAETRASNPALETRKCEMLSSAGF